MPAAAPPRPRRPRAPRWSAPPTTSRAARRVARLQAQRRGVDRDVRPRLVDDGDDAERDAHLAHVEPVGQPPALDDLADRIGQRGDRAGAVGDRGDPRPASSASRSSSASLSPASRPASMSRRWPRGSRRVAGDRARRRSRAARRRACRCRSRGERRGAGVARLRGRLIGDASAERRDQASGAGGCSRRARSSPGARLPPPRAAADRAPRRVFMPFTRRSSSAV